MLPKGRIVVKNELERRKPEEIFATKDKRSLDDMLSDDKSSIIKKESLADKRVKLGKAGGNS